MASNTIQELPSQPRHMLLISVHLHIESTDSLRTIDLMTKDTHQINVHVINVQWDLADSLGAVRMEVDTVLPADLADLLQGLLDSNLVVHSHHTN